MDDAIKCRLVARLVAFLISTLSAFAAPKLNMIVLMVDDMGWKDVGFNGNDFVETPNIDKLATGRIRQTERWPAPHSLHLPDQVQRSTPPRTGATGLQR